MRRTRLALVLLLVPATLFSKGLDIYLIDMSACTLIVTPEREAILIDCGHKMLEKRDVERIRKVVQEVAGLDRIDHLVVTHHHVDHYGAVLLLSRTVPILHFYDHGLLTELKEDPKEFETLYPEYVEASRGKRHTLRPGDTIPLQQGTRPISVRCLASDGKVLSQTGGANPQCTAATRRAENRSEDAKSVVLRVEYGDFRFLHCGDLPWNQEVQLVCPTNLVGKVDFFQTSAHGKEGSSNPVLLRSIEPTCAWMNNAPGKGGSPKVVARLKQVPGFHDAYQLHLNSRVPKERNTDVDLIANLGPRKDCPGNWIRLSVTEDTKTFSMTNKRNGKTRHYPVKPK